jgi:hypothetical protein
MLCVPPVDPKVVVICSLLERDRLLVVLVPGLLLDPDPLVMLKCAVEPEKIKLFPETSVVMPLCSTPSS